MNKIYINIKFLSYKQKHVFKYSKHTMYIIPKKESEINQQNLYGDTIMNT